MPETLSCRHLHDGTRLYGPFRITIESGIVSGMEPHDGTCDVEYITPGFVDVQVNGWADVDVAAAGEQQLRSMGATLQSLGTTCWFATLTSAPLEQMRERVDLLDALIRDAAVPGLAGIHLEGPFLGGAPGAHPERHVIGVDTEWIETLPRSVRLVTLAPEAPDAVPGIKLLRDRGVTVSLGHSSPQRHEYLEAVAHGASMVTHLFNGMSGVHHRHGGLALWALNDPAMAVGLIPDLVHTSPDIIQLAMCVKSGTLTYFVSDSVAWSSPWAQKRGIDTTSGAPRLPDGTLAGSCTSLAECFRRSVRAANIDIADAIAASSATPARLTGLNSHGHLARGAPADLLLLDRDLHVVDVRTRLPSLRA